MPYEIKPIDWLNHDNDMRRLLIANIDSDLGDIRIYQPATRCSHEGCASDAHRRGEIRLIYTLGTQDEMDEAVSSFEAAKELAVGYWHEYVERALTKSLIS